jgi:hypothetical protein
VEYLDEGSASVAKDALHNYKLDGENKIKVRPCLRLLLRPVLRRFFVLSSTVPLARGTNLTRCSIQITFARK